MGDGKHGLKTLAPFGEPIPRPPTNENFNLRRAADDRHRFARMEQAELPGPQTFDADYQTDANEHERKIGEARKLLEDEEGSPLLTLAEAEEMVRKAGDESKEVQIQDMVTNAVGGRLELAQAELAEAKGRAEDYRKWLVWYVGWLRELDKMIAESPDSFTSRGVVAGCRMKVEDFLKGFEGEEHTGRW